jgi:hypothetical protein
VINRPVMYGCFLCRSRFRFGPRGYQGKAVNKCDLMVCDGCRSTNRAHSVIHRAASPSSSVTVRGQGLVKQKGLDTLAGALFKSGYRRPIDSFQEAAVPL